MPATPVYTVGKLVLKVVRPFSMATAEVAASSGLAPSERKQANQTSGTSFGRMPLMTSLTALPVPTDFRSADPSGDMR